MPGNSANPSRRVTAKKGATVGSGGKNRSGLKGRGRTLPADERPWHKGYSGTEKLPDKTARKQDRERRAAAAEGRAPKVGVPGSKDTTWGRGGGRAFRSAAASSPSAARAWRPAAGPIPPGRARSCCSGAIPVVEALRATVPATALYVAQGIDVDDRISEIIRTAGDRGIPILEIGRTSWTG
jgi:23S rRNA (guanosine2251-2'-O)-methyltransferase